MVDGTTTRTTERKWLNVEDSSSSDDDSNAGVKVRMPAGNRNKLPNVTLSTSNNDSTTGVSFWTPKTNGYTDLTVEFTNATFQAAGPPLVGSLAPMEIQKVAVEWPIGSGNIYPMYLSNYNGVEQDETARGKLLQPGDYAQWHIELKIPRNSQYRIRFFRYSGVNGPNYTIPQNQLTHAGFNDAFHTDDRVDSGNLTLYAATTQIYGPTSVTGTSDVADVPRVAFIGDSRMYRSGSTGDPWAGYSTQGDYISSNFNKIYPYMSLGNESWAELAFGNELPYLNLGIASSTAGAWTASNRAYEIRLLQEANINEVIFDLVINDLLGGVTGDSCIARIKAAINLVRASIPGVRIGICTPLPVSNSSDAYVTITNQSLSGTLSGGGTPSNWALFTGTDGTTGRSQVLKAIRENSVGADYVIDVCKKVCHPADERYWGIQYGYKSTSDGIHQNNPAHWRASSAIDLPRMFGVFPPTDEPRLNEVTGSVYMSNLDRTLPVSTVSEVATIYLPRVPMLGQSHIITDVGGNATTNNITVNDADGNLVDTIATDGASRRYVYQAAGSGTSILNKWVAY